MAGIEKQVGIGIEKPRAGPCRRNQPAQHRRHPFRIDRETQVLVIGGGRDALPRLQFQQLFRIDGDGVCIHRGGGRDGAGDDLALRQKAFHPRIDQPLTELVEVENATDQNDRRGHIEEEDAAREAGKHRIAKNASDDRQRMDTMAAFAAAIFGIVTVRDGFRRFLQQVYVLATTIPVVSPDCGSFKPLRGSDILRHKAFQSYRSHHRPV